MISLIKVNGLRTVSLMLGLLLIMTMGLNFNLNAKNFGGATNVAAAGIEVYVDSNVSVGGDGTISNPYNSIATALPLMTNSGGTIYLRAGVYGTPDTNSGNPDDPNGTITFSNINATQQSPILVSAYNGENAVVTGRGTGTTGNINISGSSYITIKDISFDGISVKGATVNTSNYVIIDNCKFLGNLKDFPTYAPNDLMNVISSNYIDILNCTFSGNGRYLSGTTELDGDNGNSIYFNGVTHSQINYCSFSKAGHGVITLKDVGGTTFSMYNIVKGNYVDQGWGSGIAIARRSQYNLLEDNIIYNAGWGIQMQGKSGSQITAIGTIIRNNIYAKGGTGDKRYQPEMVNDANPETYWYAAWGTSAIRTDDPQWIAIDLGTDTEFSKINLTWMPGTLSGGVYTNLYYYTNYSIQTSEDGRTWSDIKTITGNQDLANEIILDSPVTARFVRMNGTKRPNLPDTLITTCNGCKLAEFEVYDGVDPQNIAIGKKTFVSSIYEQQDIGITLQSFFSNPLSLEALDNQIYNNDMVENGGIGVHMSVKGATQITGNRIFNNIVYGNRVNSSGYNDVGLAGAYSMEYDDVRDINHFKPFITGNEMFNNIFSYRDYVGDVPGFSQMIGTALWVKSLAQVQTDYPNEAFGNIDGNPKFVDYANVDLDANNYKLTEGSPAVDAGAHYAKTTAAGADTMTVPVDNALPFFDGYGRMDGDTIWVGASQTEVKIIAIDYTNNIITVDTPVTFGAAENVDFPYNGKAPDLGVYESVFVALSPSPTPTPTLTPEPTLTPTPEPTLAPTPTPTLTPTPTPEITLTPIPEITPTPTPVVTETPTPTPTLTPTPTPIATPVPSFTDISGHWAESYINTLAVMGIMSGYPLQSGLLEFRPDNPMQRQEFAKIITVAYNVFDPLAVTTFADCDQNAWYIPYVGSLVNEGLTTGMGNGTYGVGLKMTRQDTSTMLARAMVKYQFITLPELGAATTALSVFTDAVEIGDYAKPAVAFFADAKIINGYAVEGAGFEFRPKANITRAEISKIMLLALNYLPTPTPTPTP